VPRAPPRERPSPAVSLLELRDVVVRHGEAVALSGVTLTIEDGEFTAVLGKEAAGKTSLLRAIARTVRVSGEIRFEGDVVTRHSPAAMCRLGVAHVPQGGGTLARLSVLDNLRLGAWTVRGPLDNAYARVFEFFPFLYDRRNALAGTLSPGEQRLLGLGSAVMGKPRLLVCDEPTAGVPRDIGDDLFAAFRELHGRGTTIVVTAQRKGRALASAGHAVILESGQVAFDGPAAEVSVAPAADETSLAS
jgi:branched-chain amino acid transport system ATP-binding protein